jgi:Flp pilus assembly protein TadD
LNNGTGASHHGHNQWANNGNWNSHHGNWNGHHGNWNGHNWNGNNWNGGWGGGWNNWNRGFNRGFGFSPFFGFYPFGFSGLGWGWPYYGGFGYGWGSPWGYNRYCGYGGFGYGGYGGYGYGYPYSSYSNYAYTTAYPDTTPVAVVDQVQQPVADTAVANNEFAAQGEAQFKAGDYAGAAKSWRHAMVDDPNNATLFLMMSQALFASGNYDEAAGALQMGLMQMPEDQWGVVVENYKELYAPNDDYANQLKALEKAAKEKPEDPARQVLLGYHYGYLGYPVQAVVKLNRTMELAPQDMMAQKLREVMATKASAKGQTVEPAPKLPDNPAPIPGAAAPPAGAAAASNEAKPSLPAAETPPGS